RNKRGGGGITMGLLTMLGYTPLTPHQNARARVWRDALAHARQKLAFGDSIAHELHLDTQIFAVTHRHRKGGFAPGVTIPTEEDAARVFARLDEDPHAWIAERQHQLSAAQDEAMRPIREHIARRKAMRTSLEQWAALSPIEFEHACAELLRRSGYADVRVTRASGDGGVDVIASKDGRGFAVQCKRYQHTVGPEPVR